MSTPSKLQVVQAYDRVPIGEVDTDDAAALEAKLATATRAFRDRSGRLKTHERVDVLRDVALHAADRLDASAVMINDHTAFRTDWMPFAGRRESGYGVGGIPYTMREMAHEKMRVLRYPS